MGPSCGYQYAGHKTRLRRCGNGVNWAHANVAGSRAKCGVIYDFIVKLRKDRRELEVLGDGTQTKSHLYVDDCLEAFLVKTGRMLLESRESSRSRCVYITYAFKQPNLTVERRGLAMSRRCSWTSQRSRGMAENRNIIARKVSDLRWNNSFRRSDQNTRSFAHLA